MGLGWEGVLSGDFNDSFILEMESAVFDLREFVVEKVLNFNEDKKILNVAGYFKSLGTQKVAIVKLHLKLPELESELFSNIQSFTMFHGNDVFNRLDAVCLYKLEFEVVYPATKYLYSKALSAVYYSIAETPHIYNTVTKPYIDSLPSSQIQWLYNILNKQSETDSIIYEDPDPDTGFILNADYKYKKYSSSTFYFQVLPFRKDIRTIRDLRSIHLPLLYNILNQTKSEIASHLNISPYRISIYFHYLPSFYHLHCHVVPQGMHTNDYIGRGHLLEEVIRNIQSDGDYYAKATISIEVADTVPLYTRYREMLQDLPEPKIDQDYEKFQDRLD